MEAMPSTQELAKLLRYWSITSTTAAGSGHPTSALSAADLMAVLFFGGFFRFDVANPRNPANDHLIFSKGHAAPLLYALWAAAGVFPAEKLETLRQKDSFLQGHPGMDFPYAEAATGSLGQGLSIGLGIALAGQLDGLDYKTYVLLGDGELAEGNIWEAAQIASHYQLENLIAVADINRLEQTGETQLGHDLETYKERFSSFGWHVILVDGHNHDSISQAFDEAHLARQKPTIILAKTFKGRGVSFLENKEGWHGKAVPQERLTEALTEIGNVNTMWRGSLKSPQGLTRRAEIAERVKPGSHPPGASGGQGLTFQGAVSVRQAYGEALVDLAPHHSELVVLDADLSNSTYSETFKQAFPDRYREMFIAEQNMVATAVGLSVRGKHPFVSTFGAFFTRAFDQVRMASYSLANIVFCGSHVGVSIGQDGVSQMGLEDISLFRTIRGSTIFYPCDAWSMVRLAQLAAERRGIVYLRSTRAQKPLIYQETDQFRIGGSHTLREGKDLTIATAGITVFETLLAARRLMEQGVDVKVLDLYSIKPIDQHALLQAAKETKRILVVEDHYPEGGLGEAVLSALTNIPFRLAHLAVRGIPHSGTPEENLAAAGIDAASIERAALGLMR